MVEYGTRKFCPRLNRTHRIHNMSRDMSSSLVFASKRSDRQSWCGRADQLASDEGYGDAVKATGTHEFVKPMVGVA